MKVVDVAEFYADQGGGVKTYINQKLAAGAARGHEVVVVAPGPEDRDEARHGGRVVWIKSPPLPPDPRYYVFMRASAIHAVLDCEAPDVLEGSSPWRGGRYAARWRGKAARAFVFHQDPVAVYPETFLGRAIGSEAVNTLFSPYWAYLRRLSRRYDHTVVAGQWLADKLSGLGLQSPVAVPFGIEKTFFRPERRRPEVRARWLAACNAPEDATLWITVSRFHPEKRLGTLVRAFKAASAKRPMAWVIFGGGPLEGWLRRAVRGIAGVHVAGYTKDRDELADAMAAGDGFLHGSAAETYGIVIAEALCSGLPLVVPNVGGAADLASDAYAECYDPGDAAGCADAMLRLAARAPEATRSAVASAAKQRVRTIDEHFDDLFSTYERWIG